MNVLMLNTFDNLGGAARAATRLLTGIRGQGVAARMLVHFKEGADTDVLCQTSPAVRATRRLKLYLGTLPVRRYANRPENNFSPALLPDHLHRRVDELAPDLVHLHWLGAGFCRPETLPKLGRPLVWTLHDSWAFTGGCHVPFGCEKYRLRCGACPVLGSDRESDLSRRVWERKEAAWRNLQLTLVAPSRWMADCAKSSSLLARHRVEVIPNGLDLQSFQPMDKGAARERLGLPGQGQIALFGAFTGIGDPNKGWHLLEQALQAPEVSSLTQCVAVFGIRPKKPPELGIPLIFLGPLADEMSLAAAYSAADVFVAPSRQEAFCQTAAESLACGTPVVAFRCTGLLDVVSHGEDGYLAQPYEVEDLARGLVWILEDRNRRAQLGRQARGKAVERFGLSAIAGRYVSLYQRVLSEGGPRSAR